MIELKNVVKTYATGKTFVEALKGVDFLSRSQTLCLFVGPRAQVNRHFSTLWVFWTIRRRGLFKWTEGQL